MAHTPSRDARPQLRESTTAPAPRLFPYLLLIAGVLLQPLLLLSPSVLGADSAQPAWSLVWADEFDQTDGSAPSPAKWTYDTGGGGWGNNELQTYTARTQNARIEAGQLIIEARKETFTGSDSIKRDYTSARLITRTKATWTYGRIEARIQIPQGQGIWPAFWTLGANIESVRWPACGEIDVMENIGREPSTVHGTLHGPGYSGGGGIGKPHTLEQGQKFADGFHLFAVEWQTNQVRWLVDNKPFFTLKSTGLPAGAKWVFDKPQYLLLNVAVGGNWPGKPDATTVFPQRMRVDYVRVYARAQSPAPTLRLERLPDRIEARWPLPWPQASLERTSLHGDPWTAQVTAGTRTSTEFTAIVQPGFYRLRWQ